MSTAHRGSVRTTPTFGGGNANRAAPLHTEPTRTPRWKCAIKENALLLQTTLYTNLCCHLVFVSTHGGA